MEFKKAERKQAKLRLALASPAGGGKTYSALLIAKGLGGKIAMIDTEHGSGSLYAGVPGMPDYDVLELSPPFSPRRYVEGIKTAEKAGFTVLIIDSLSHAWAAEGGVLDMQEAARLSSKSGNSWTAWREVTPQHNELVEGMLQSSLHIIATMRSRQSYAQEDVDGPDGKRKAVIKKLGLAPVQREGMDYEFTVVLDLSQEHYATSSKDRTMLFDGLHFKPSEETGKQLLDWLNKGGTKAETLKVTPPASSPPKPLNTPQDTIIAISSPLTGAVTTGQPPAKSHADVNFEELPSANTETAIQKQARIDEVSRVLAEAGYPAGTKRESLFGLPGFKAAYPGFNLLADMPPEQTTRLLAWCQKVIEKKTK